MIKQQIHEKFLIADLDTDLMTDISKPRAKFQKEPGNILDKGVFQITLVKFITHRQKIKNVWILQCLLSQITLRQREGFGKIGNGFTVSLIQTSIQHIQQNTAAPVPIQGFLNIEESFLQ